MSVEPAVYIDTLVPANPPSSDGVAEGDDHIRLLKSVLQATFPNITAAMTATSAELNATEGRLDTLETTVGALDNGLSVVPISGVLEQAEPVNAQSGANYAILYTDRGHVVTRTHTTAMSDTIAQATGNFGAGWFCFVDNIDTADFITLTPTTSTINGAATLSIPPGYRAKITSDGTNYLAVLWLKSGVAWRRSAKSAAYTLLPTDVRPTTIFEFTTAGVTLDTTVAASNFTGFPIIVRNSASSGVVTFDPNSTETVDGNLTATVYPGQTRVFMSNGTNYVSIGGYDHKFLAQNAQNAAYTFTLEDAGSHVFHDEVTARVYTIPANSSVAFPVGTVITIVNNNGAGAITLSITTDTLRRGDGTAGTGSRTIPADAIATIIKTKSTEWMITGTFT